MVDEPKEPLGGDRPEGAHLPEGSSYLWSVSYQQRTQFEVSNLRWVPSDKISLSMRSFRARANKGPLEAVRSQIGHKMSRSKKEFEQKYAY